MSDPFGYTAKSKRQKTALDSAQRAGDSFAGVKSAARKALSFLDRAEAARNAQQNAEGGYQFKTNKLNAKQRKRLSALLAKQQRR